MKFRAVTSTADGRILVGNIYHGGFVWRGADAGKGINSGLRVVVYDDKQEWKTFDPRIFVPYQKPLIKPEVLSVDQRY